MAGGARHLQCSRAVVFCVICSFACQSHCCQPKKQRQVAPTEHTPSGWKSADLSALPSSGLGHLAIPPNPSPDPHSYPSLGPFTTGSSATKKIVRVLRGGWTLQHYAARVGRFWMGAGGIPTASEGGAESEVAHKWARWLHNPCHLGGAHCFRAGGAESEVSHKWARWLHNPCCLGVAHRFRAGGRI